MTYLPIVQHKEAFQQYEDFASKTMVTMTDTARDNLKKLEEDDKITNAQICLWTGLYRDAPGDLKSRRLNAISLKNAAIINAHVGRTIIALDLKQIKYVCVPKSATGELNRVIEELEKQGKKLSFSRVAKEIGKDKVINILTGVKNDTATRVDLECARAVDKYFFAQFKTKLFDADNLFKETKQYLESAGLNLSPSKKISEPAKGAKRPLEHAEKNLEVRSKRRKISTEAAQEPSAPKKTEESSDPLPEKNEFSMGEILKQPLPSEETSFYNQEKLSYDPVEELSIMESMLEMDRLLGEY